MGSFFIEISKARPTYEQEYLERRQNVIKEGSLWVLDYILRSMPKSVRSNFPMLQKIERESPDYHGEDLILTPEEVKKLNVEFLHILKIDGFEEFLPQLDSNVFRNLWREKSNPLHLFIFGAFLAPLQHINQRINHGICSSNS